MWFPNLFFLQILDKVSMITLKYTRDISLNLEYDRIDFGYISFPELSGVLIGLYLSLGKLANIPENTAVKYHFELGDKDS